MSTGAPRSVRADPASPAHFIQASMPVSICSGVALAICSRAEVGDRYRDEELGHDSSFRRPRRQPSISSPTEKRRTVMANHAKRTREEWLAARLELLEAWT